MTVDDVRGLYEKRYSFDWSFFSREMVGTLLAEIDRLRAEVAAERERCARVADGVLNTLVGHANHGYGEGAEEIAAIIAREIRTAK